MPFSAEKRAEIAEKRFEQVRQVDELRKKGVLVKEACAQVGIEKSCYSNWKFGKQGELNAKAKRRLKTSKEPKPVAIHIPTAEVLPSGKLFVLMGAPREVLEVVRMLQ